MIAETGRVELLFAVGKEAEHPLGRLAEQIGRIRRNAGSGEIPKPERKKEEQAVSAFSRTPVESLFRGSSSSDGLWVKLVLWAGACVSCV